MDPSPFSNSWMGLLFEWRELRLRVAALLFVSGLLVWALLTGKKGL
jgi:hypothetical protein